MNKILAFAGSNSSTSINHKFLQFIQRHYDLPTMKLISLRELAIPMYGMDMEKSSGFPDSVIHLNSEINSSKNLLIATAEHNGSMTAYLKSTFDWLSRVNKEFLKDKNVFIIGTSPGRGGARGAIEQCVGLSKRLEAKVINQFSLPSYNHVFENEVLAQEYSQQLDLLIEELKNS